MSNDSEILDVDYLKKAIECSSLLPEPGGIEVRKIVESHLALAVDCDLWHERCQIAVEECCGSCHMECDSRCRVYKARAALKEVGML